MFSLALCFSLAVFVVLWMSFSQKQLDGFKGELQVIKNQFANIMGTDENAKRELEKARAEIAKIKADADALKDKEIERLKKELNDKRSLK